MALALRRCLGVLPTTGQALATVGLTITAVINIPAALAAGSGHGTWLCYAIALVAMLLVVETLVLFRRHPTRADGIAGYVAAGLGQGSSTLAAWALFFGYGALFVGCLSFFAAYLASLLQPLGLALPVLALFALGGAAALLLARRDVPVSATTMLASETVSVLLVMALCGLVLLAAAGRTTPLPAPEPLGTDVGAGLMAAVLSFIGFESAANLGEEVSRPQQAIPLALRSSVLLAGMVFLFWAVVLTEGLSWLPVAVRQGTDPLLALSELLHWPLAGRLVELGAALSLFGTSLGSLTAMGRLGYVLAQVRVLPPALAIVDGRFATPARALAASALPAMLLGAALLQAGQTPQSLYDGFGGGAVLAFLLVYGLVAMAALQNPLPGTLTRRRQWTAGTCLIVCTVVLLSYGRTLLQGQPMLLVGSLGILTIGALLVQRTVRGG
jgi:amino acid transporter